MARLSLGFTADLGLRTVSVEVGQNTLTADDLDPPLVTVTEENSGSTPDAAPRGHRWISVTVEVDEFTVGALDEFINVGTAQTPIWAHLPFNV